jgi:hypothetical protein
MVGYSFAMDQHVVTDWKAYFASLPPGRPVTYPDRTPMFEGPYRPSVVFVKGPLGDLEVVRFEPDEENLLERAKEVWEANDGPEMWVFINSGGPPWHCPARPKPKKKGR